MATIKPNSYVLNVDIKQRMSNKTPRFVQFDEAQIVFKIYDGGKPFDLSGFTSAVVTHKTRSNQVISGYGTFEDLNGQRVVVYDYMGSEMKELGNVETSLSIYNDENDKVSVMPFNVQIVRDLSHEYSEKDTSVLQDLIAKTTDAISKIEYAEDQGDYAKEQGTFAETQGNHAKTQGDYAQTQGTRAETLGNKAETQVGQAQDILDVAVPAYERVEEVYSNTVNLENQHAYDATKQYHKNNIVEFNGSSYQALQDTKGNQPPVNASNEYWSLLARKGADGTGTVVRHREEFISTEGQTTFTLKNTYDQFQNRIDVTVGNVPQFSPDNFTEATNTSIKLNEPLPAGIQVVVTYFSEAQPLKSDIQTVVNNHTTNLNENNATISSLSTQLAETAKQSDLESVNKALSEKIGRGVKAEPEDLSDRTLELVTGGGTVNVLSVPQDNSVNTKKIAPEGLKPSVVQGVDTIRKKRTVNLFDKSKAITGGYYSATTGEWVNDSKFASTGFIPLRHGTYQFTKSSNVAKWSATKKYIRGGVTANPVLVNENDVFYLTFSIPIEDLDTFMITRQGEYPTSYVPYYEETFKLNSLWEGQNKTIVEPAEMKGVKVIKEKRTINLFNKERAILGGFYSPTTGEWVVSSEYATSDFIPVQPGTYKATEISDMVKWDINKNRITGGTTQNISVGANEGVAFITFNMPISELDKTMFTVFSEYPSSYVPYYEDSYAFGEEWEVIRESNPLEPQKVKGVAKDEVRTLNLFNKNNIIKGGFFNKADGSWANNSRYVSSNFIDVSNWEAGIYSTNFSTILVKWDQNKNFMRGGEGVDFRIENDGAKYVTIRVHESEIDSMMFANRDTFPSKYAPYFRELYTPDDSWNVPIRKEFEIIEDKVRNVESAFSARYTEPIELDLKDFSRYNQPYHPDPMYIPGGFNGYKYWLVQSPYPIGANPYRDRWEAPIVYKSNDRINWITVADPLDDITPEEVANGDYMSDPDLVYREDTQTLEVWYRLTHKVNGTLPTKIFRKTTTDGENWTEREEMIPEELHTTDKFVRSPSFSWDNTRKVYRAWYTNDYGIFYNELPENGVWDKNALVKVTLEGVSNYWHIDVDFYNNEYHLLGYQSKDQSIVHHTSTDGLSFGKGKKILSSSDGNPLYSTSMYKAGSMMDEFGKINVFFSGVNADNKTRVGLVIADSFEDIVGVRKIDSEKVLLKNGMTLEELAKAFFELKASIGQ